MAFDAGDAFRENAGEGPGPHYQVSYFTGIDYDAFWAYCVACDFDEEKLRQLRPSSFCQDLGHAFVHSFDPRTTQLPIGCDNAVLLNRWAKKGEKAVGMYSYGHLVTWETGKTLIADMARAHKIDPPFPLPERSDFILSPRGFLSPLSNKVLAVFDPATRMPVYTPQGIDAAAVLKKHL